MEIRIDKSFQKDTRKIHDKKLLVKLAESIQEIQNAENISQIRNLKKLRGNINEYRIKIGDYRIGLLISNDIVEFVRCLHRKDIYKYFPK